MYGIDKKTSLLHFLIKQVHTCKPELLCVYEELKAVSKAADSKENIAIIFLLFFPVNTPLNDCQKITLILLLLIFIVILIHDTVSSNCYY